MPFSVIEEVLEAQRRLVGPTSIIQIRHARVSKGNEKKNVGFNSRKKLGIKDKSLTKEVRDLKRTEILAAKDVIETEKMLFWKL